MARPRGRANLAPIVRILLDYRPALVTRTGVGEYVHRLAEALVRVLGRTRRDHAVRQLVEGPARPDAIPGAAVVDSRLPARLLTALWHRAGLAAGRAAGRRALGHRALGPADAGARRARGVRLTTIHDLDFLDHPERTQAEFTRPTTPRWPAATRTRPTTSSPSRPTPPAKSRPGSGSRAAGSPCAGRARPAWPLRMAPPPASLGYVLFVGTLEPRKNVGGLLDAYGRLVARHPQAPPLVLAGRTVAGVGARGSRGLSQHAARRARPASRLRPGRGARRRSTPARRAGPAVVRRRLRPAGARSDDASACRSSPRIAARCRRCSATPACWSSPDDPEELAAAMQRVLDRRPPGRHAAAPAARGARCIFDWMASAATLREIYEALADRRARPRAAGSAGMRIARRRARAGAASDRRRPLPARDPAGVDAAIRPPPTATSRSTRRPTSISASPRLRGAGRARPAARPAPGRAAPAWEQLRLPLALPRETDVLFAPGYSAPLLRPAPTVVADPRRVVLRPSRVVPAARRRSAAAGPAASRRPTRATVLTVSEFSRPRSSAGSACRRIGSSSRRSASAPGVRPPAHGRPRAARAPLVLFVGIAAQPPARPRPGPRLRAARRPRCPAPGWSSSATTAATRPRTPGPSRATSASPRRSRPRPWIADDELAALYGQATRVRVPVDYEGFGLPPLEAMAAGVPVVASTRRWRARVYGDGGDARAGRRRRRGDRRALLAFGTDAARRVERPRGPALRHVHAVRLDADGARPTLAALREAAAVSALDHRHRQLQRARRPRRAASTVAARRAAGDRRTRSSSSTTRRPTAAPRRRARWPGVRLIALAGNRRLRRRQQRRHPRDQRRADPAPQQRHDRARRRRSTGWSAALRAIAGRRRGRPAPGRRRRAARAVVRRHDRAAGRMAAEAAAGAPRRAGAAERLAAHRGADRAPRSAGLGERRLPAGAARRRRGGRPARRALLHVPRGRRLLRGAARPRPAHPVRARTSTVVHLRGPLAAGRAGAPPSAPTAAATCAFYDKHHPRWAPLLRRWLTLARLQRAPDTDAGRRTACGSASMPASCTTSASAPTSGTCCGSWRGSIDDDRVRRCSAGRTTSPALRALGANFRPVVEPAPATTRSREQIEMPLALRRERRRRCSTRRTTCCRRWCRAASVVTIHDCIHLMFPQYLPNRLALCYARRVRCGRRRGGRRGS